MDNLLYHLRSLRHRRPKDLVMYVVINALIIAVVFAILSTGLSWDLFVKWFGFAGITAIFFWYLIADFRVLWKRNIFWWLTITCFFAHCAIWMVILTHVEHWKFIWFYPMLIEMTVFLYFRDLLLIRQSRNKRPSIPHPDSIN
jgi:hypothetical protein